MNGFKPMAAPSDFPASCPGCHASYDIPLSMAGQLVSCETCQTDFILPEAPLPPGTEASPSFPNSMPAKQVIPGPWFKNVLLVLSGAALVWGLSAWFKQSLTGELENRMTAHGRNATGTDAPDSTRTGPAITPPRPEPPRPEGSADPPQPAGASPAKTPASEASGPVPEVVVIPENSPGPGIPSGTALQTPPETAPPATDPPAVPASPASPAAILTPESSFPTGSPKASIVPSGARGHSRQTLERFLRANNMEERLSVSQNPDKIRAAMEQHYRTWPDGPLHVEKVAFLTDGKVPDTKRKFHLYNVTLKDQEAPIPIAVEETKDGYRVDWPTFAESYTHRLRAFFAAPTTSPGRFRVMLRRAHYFGAAVPGQDTIRIAYTVEPPMRDETFHVWVDKDSLVFKEKLATGERAGWEAESYVIVELLWRGDEKRGRWVSLHRIPADSWRTE